MMAWTSSSGLGLSALLASVILICEMMISVGLILGFFTRLAGMGVVIIMSGALFFVAKTPSGLLGMELSLMFWSAGIALFCLGGGAFSLDRTISKNLLPMVG